MSEDSPPYWVLISVLFSTFPLSPKVAMTLHQVAQALYQSDGAEAPVAGDLCNGRVRNLRKEFLVGTIGGHGFEAELETERGQGTVRFLLTRQGMELAERAQQAPPRPQYLH